MGEPQVHEELPTQRLRQLRVRRQPQQRDRRRGVLGQRRRPLPIGVQQRRSVVAGEEDAAAYSASTVGSANSSSVTIPKLPLPPRSAQNSSGSCSASTSSTAPSAVTSSSRDSLGGRGS
jgi:hypothetical protein